MSQVLAPASARRWTMKDIAERYDVSRSTVRNWEASGVIPKGRRITPRTVRWDPDEVEAAIMGIDSAKSG